MKLLDSLRDDRAAHLRDSAIQLRRIRSFVRREGRLTRAQEQALTDYWSSYGLPLDASPAFDHWFHRPQPTHLEIGFGNGETLVEMAARSPDQNFIGIEVHRPGVGHLLQRIESLKLHNVRVFNEDAVEVLRRCIPDQALDAVYLFFPDPWHKKRHHKRRLVQPKFMQLVTQKLKPGGLFHAATDWQNYAEHMMTVLESSPDLENLSGAYGYAERPESRPLTKFEQRGLRLGHEVWDLRFQRRAG